jgi:hypothetical protein
MSPSKSKFWYSKSNLHFSKLAVSLTVFKKCQTPAYFPVTKKKLLNIDTRVIAFSYKCHGELPPRSGRENAHNLVLRYVLINYK